LLEDYSEMYALPSSNASSFNADKTFVNLICQIRSDGKKFVTELYGYIPTELLTSNKDYATGRRERADGQNLLNQLEYLLPGSDLKESRKLVAAWWPKVDALTSILLQSEEISQLRERLVMASIKEAQSINHATHSVEASNLRSSSMNHGEAVDSGSLQVTEKFIDEANKWHMDIDRNIDNINGILWDNLSAKLPKKLHRVMKDVEPAVERFDKLRSSVSAMYRLVHVFVSMIYVTVINK
jgi:hypothetical protein